MSKYAKDQPEGFTNRIEKVAIVGAGGQVGQAITEALVKTGQHTVTAITREDSDNKLPEGVDRVAVDYDDEESLVTALQGQQYLVITMSVLAADEVQHKLIAAAAKAGVRYVMPNSFSIDLENEAMVNSPVLLAKKTIEAVKEIKRYGVSVSNCLVCNTWYEYSLALSPATYGFDFRDRKVTFYDDGLTRINTTTWAQCGRTVAALVSLKELPDDENDESVTLSRWNDKSVYVSSFLISQRDMLDSVNRVLKTSDADWSISHEPAEERHRAALAALQAGDPTAGGKAAYAHVFFKNGCGDYETRRGLDNDLLGLPREDLDEATKTAVRMVESGWEPKFLAGLKARFAGKN